MGSLLNDSLIPFTWNLILALPILGAGELLSNLNQWTQVALGLGFVIFVHELGHFLAAKTFGVRCDKFYVGFDVPIRIGPIRLPASLAKFKWGETEYGIGIIPLGGYVKMLGQDDDPRKAEEEAAKTRQGDGEEAPLDPRSYTAKPVWQRMIIISAGVVMNLIFAVILAGVAYYYGVKYTPTVVGDSYAGGPAWQADIRPGDQVLKVAGMPAKLEKLRFDDFRMETVFHGLDYGDKEIPIQLRRNGEIVESGIIPTQKYSPARLKLYTIGCRSSLTPTIGPMRFSPNSYLAEANPAVQPGDVVVAFNGEKLPVDERYGVTMGDEFIRRFQANWNKPVTLELERKDSPNVLVEIPAIPVKSIGIGFAMGPVTALRKSSPAAESGIQVGDLIQKINGEAVVDSLRLPHQAALLAGQEVTLEVLRGTGDKAETLEFKMTGPEQARFDMLAPVATELSLSGLGIAYAVEKTISVVDEAASKAGFEVGDELLKVQWVVTDEERAALSGSFRDIAFEVRDLDEKDNTALLFSDLQGIPEKSTLVCAVRRDGKIKDNLKGTVAYQEDWNWHIRSLSLTSLSDVHYAKDLSDAAALGFWETKRRFKSVLRFLRLLVTGRLSINGLGGPITIAQQAASEASFGTSRLLLFLTMLSANLAILNFLPIPALDGGHMVFLTAEAIMGKPVNEALQIRLTMAGVLCLLGLMAFVIVKDIAWLT